MAGRLEGKVALITGGGSGMGRSAALSFTREGAKVVIADVADDGGNETVQLVTTAGGDATYVHCDVASARDIESAVAQAVAAYGRLDCAFNNAGIEGAPGSFIGDVKEEDWDRVHAINLKGVWLCMKYEIQQFLAQGGPGAIVNNASAAALSGWPEGSVYAAAKSGVISLTKTAGLEYGSKGIRVNAVCPGFIRTPMAERMFVDFPELPKLYADLTPLGRVGEAAEVAEAVAWLCSAEASFVSGAVLSVDGSLMAGGGAPPAGIGADLE